MPKSSRTHVIEALLAIQQGQSLATLLTNLLEQVTPDDKAFVHALLLTTLRHWHATARLVDKLADKPIDETQVRTAIQVGMTQLLYLDVAEHASIFETVEAVKQIGFARASGLVNAVLRKVAKNPAKYRKLADKNHSLPNWLARQLKQDWGEQYNELTQALRLAAPIFLRPNTKFCTVQDYENLLDDTNIEHEIVSTGLQNAHSHAQAIRLNESVKINELPKFAEGWVSVQDLHAQLAGHLLLTGLSSEASEPLNVLDACCAPGGKTAHLLELAEQNSRVNSKKFHMKHLTAIDNEPNRLQRVKQNLTRLHLDDEALITIQTADATIFGQENFSQKFDVILLDAPCTATGVIRRHPDIGLLRTEADVSQTVTLQASILHNLWHSLADGGCLLYVTCSILKAENEEQLAEFMATHADAEAVDFDLNLSNQFKRPIGWQCLPLDAHGGDGFYYAMLKKR